MTKTSFFFPNLLVVRKLLSSISLVDSELGGLLSLKESKCGRLISYKAKQSNTRFRLACICYSKINYLRRSVKALPTTFLFVRQLLIS